MASKNDPNKRDKSERKKLVGKCGHTVTPILVKGIKGSARMRRLCEQCGIV